MKGFSGLPASLLGAALLLLLLPATAAAAPQLPLSTTSRWIVDATGARVKLRCVNWAGHMEANIPEGLHKQPIEHIADVIRDQGFNCVRLTYSIDHALAPDVRVADSFAALASLSSSSSSSASASISANNNTAVAAAAAAAAANTTASGSGGNHRRGIDRRAADGLFAQVSEKNPFAADATTRDVFAAVISALWDRGVMTILDNHLSKASWCCESPLVPVLHLFGDHPTPYPPLPPGSYTPFSGCFYD